MAIQLPVKAALTVDKGGGSVHIDLLGFQIMFQSQSERSKSYCCSKTRRFERIEESNYQQWVISEKKSLVMPTYINKIK